MGAILTWLMTLVQPAEQLVLNSLPQVLTTLFSGAGFTPTLASSILAEVEQFATNALGNLGLTQYIRAWLKAWFSFCNQRPASAATTLQWQLTLVAIQMANGTVRQAGTNARLALAWLQPLVDDAETANTAASTPATVEAVSVAQANRDAAAEYLEALEQCEEQASQGKSITVPTAPAILAPTLAAINAALNAAPTNSGAASGQQSAVSAAAVSAAVAPNSGGASGNAAPTINLTANGHTMGLTPGAGAETSISVLPSGQLQLTVG